MENNRTDKVKKDKPYKIVTMMCAGYELDDKHRKHIKFVNIKNGKIMKEGELNFGVDRLTDKPVGSLIKIEFMKNSKYRGFNYVGEAEISSVILDEVKKQSAINDKIDNLEKQRLRKDDIKKTIESMTVCELREWAKKSLTNRKAIKFYLYEVF